MKKYSRKHVFDKEGQLLPLEQRTFKTNEGYDCILIDGGSKNIYVTAKIEEYVFEVTISNLKKGRVKYPFHSSIYGRGYFGVGKYKASENGEPTKVYDLWKSMLCRAYGIEFHKMNTTYKDVEVCEEWYNFQNFAIWFYEESNYHEGYVLDKDLLSGSKKVYSPQTCVFVPQALNNFLTNKQVSNTSGCTGVHWNKQAKKWQVYIKDVTTGKRKHLGYFINIEEASRAYKSEREKYAKIWRGRMKGVLPDNALKNII